MSFSSWTTQVCSRAYIVAQGIDSDVTASSRRATQAATGRGSVRLGVTSESLPDIVVRALVLLLCLPHEFVAYVVDADGVREPHA